MLEKLNKRFDLTLLESLLDLDRKVVGIKFIFDKEEYEERKESTINNMMVYCTLVRNASQGKSYKVNLENFACLSAARALGLMPSTNDNISGVRHSKMGVYKDLCVSRSVAKDMVYCKHEVYGVCIKPLEEYEEDPDVVIIVTNPYNAMRIIQGNAYYNGQTKEIKMAGMQAICQECTSYPYETNDLNISMMCSGTRLVAQWDKSELGIGIPFNKFSTIVDGIKSTVNPMEKNQDKKRIEDRLKTNDLENEITIQYNTNYYRGGYTGIKGQNKRK